VRRDFNDIFSTLDVNGDGSIDRQELFDFIRDWSPDTAGAGAESYQERIMLDASHVQVGCGGFHDGREPRAGTRSNAHLKGGRWADGCLVGGFG
jgi:hypothetical protein